MRINTSGKKEWRTDLYERTADTLNENTKTGAIDNACIHTNQDLNSKREALEYLRDRLSGGELEEVANILSTDAVTVSVELRTDISVPE